MICSLFGPTAITLESMSNFKPREPILLDLYRRFQQNHDTVRFVFAVSSHYGSGTLERLAVHEACEMRQAAVLALGFIGDYVVNHTVCMALQDEDRMVRVLAGKACRRVWNRDGDSSQRRRLSDTIRLNAARRSRDAIEKASLLIDEASWFAEAWYQRGAARFQLEDLPRALLDWKQTLELNPYHFVAATAMGTAYTRQNDPVAALESLRRALRLNPNLDNVRDQVVQIVRQIEEQ